MNDVDITFTRASALVHDRMIHALIRTHPNPDALREAFAKESAQLTADMTKEREDHSLLRAVQFRINEFLSVLPSTE